MEEFKKELFLEANKSVIPIYPLLEKDKIDIERFINLKIRIRAVSFFTDLKEALVNNKSYDSLELSVDIEKVFRDLRVLEEEIAIIIWNYPGDIDKMKLKDVIKYWEDIWFSPSDEAVAIFFPTVQKIVLITHYNIVYY